MDRSGQAGSTAARRRSGGRRGIAHDFETDTIDLLYQHRVDPEAPSKRSPGQSRMIAAGKVSTSACPRRLQTVRRAHAVQPVTASKASTRSGGGARGEILPTLEELGIGFVPFSPLGKGFLTGTMDPNRRSTPVISATPLPRFHAHARSNQALVELLRRIAERRTRAAQVALAWLLARKPWIVPIPGRRSSTSGGKHRRGRSRAHPRRPPRDRRRATRGTGSALRRGATAHHRPVARETLRRSQLRRPPWK